MLNIVTFIKAFYLATILLFPPHVWPHGPVLDQGNTPECVGYAWAGWGAAAHGLGQYWPDGDGIYRAAKSVDGLKPNDKGTTLEAGGQVLRDAGLLASVRYTNSITEAEQFLSESGPIVVGSSWYWPAITNGYLVPTQYPNDNHAYYCFGEVQDAGGPAFLCENSWGYWFGQDGVFRVRPAVLASLPYHDFALPLKPGYWITNLIQPQ